MQIKGLIFDFDGLILDTETPEFHAWQEVFHNYGVSLPLEKWAQAIGSSMKVFDPLEYLEAQISQQVDRPVIKKQQYSHSLEMIHQQPVMPGVYKIISEAKNYGLLIGLASSSSCDWVVDHLTRLGLLSSFDAIFGSDDVDVVKPNPALYLRAIDALKIKPYEAVAFEDSPNGVKAAKAAGLFCVAIPNPLTIQLNLQEADLILESLEEVSLSQILSRFDKGKNQ